MKDFCIVKRFYKSTMRKRYFGDGKIIASIVFHRNNIKRSNCYFCVYIDCSESTMDKLYENATCQ